MDDYGDTQHQSEYNVTFAVYLSSIVMLVALFVVNMICMFSLGKFKIHYV